MIDYRFSSIPSGTRIVISSSLTSSRKNLAIMGSILSIIVASLCWWISVDLENFIVTRQPNSWSWLATSGSFTYADSALSFDSLTRGFTVFLVAAFLIEVVICIYAQHEIDATAQETLKALV